MDRWHPSGVVKCHLELPPVGYWSLKIILDDDVDGFENGLEAARVEYGDSCVTLVFTGGELRSLDGMVYL